DPTWASRAASLKLTVQIGALTNNHAPLVTAIQAMPDIREASDLVRLTEGDWKSRIKSQGVGVPADTPGSNADEKADNYARRIVAQVEAAFPTQFFAARLGPSRVAEYLNAWPSYDLMKTYPAQFFEGNGISHPDVQIQLPAFQRLYRLTGRAVETIALSA